MNQSYTGNWTWQKEWRHDTERDEREKQKRNERSMNEKKPTRARINKAFEKIECFAGSDPNRCLPWLEQVHSLSNNYDRDNHEELLLNSGGSVQKTIHSIDPDATPEQIKDIVLCSHSNLKIPSQRLHAHQSIQQKPDESSADLQHQI